MGGNSAGPFRTADTNLTITKLRGHLQHIISSTTERTVRNLSSRSPDEAITTMTAFPRNRSNNQKKNKTIQRSGQEQHRNLY
uniref:Uncharacterized protein n=1 Tax=Heterorhabditis bacteriophora TaxID=37862 RepID=A0A1I7X4U7_HETBA